MFFLPGMCEKECERAEKTCVYVCVCVRVHVCARERDSAVYFCSQNVSAPHTQLWQLWARRQSSNTHATQWNEYWATQCGNQPTLIFLGHVPVCVSHVRFPLWNMCVSFTVCVCKWKPSLEGCHHAKINRVWIHECWFSSQSRPARSADCAAPPLPFARLASHSVGVRQALYHQEVCDCVRGGNKLCVRMLVCVSMRAQKCIISCLPNRAWISWLDVSVCLLYLGCVSGK